uniref:Uncharacterized protein n=1 Tax=Arundo donax TaxID=35708 RepID=A0A0A8ZF75_ARUDO
MEGAKHGNAVRGSDNLESGVKHYTLVCFTIRFKCPQAIAPLPFDTLLGYCLLHSPPIILTAQEA